MVIGGYQGFPMVIRIFNGYQRLSGVSNGYWGFSMVIGVIRGVQWLSWVFNGYGGFSMAIRGFQWLSGVFNVIVGYQRLSGVSFEGIVDDCDGVPELRHRNIKSATALFSTEANTVTVLKRMFGRHFHDGCLTSGWVWFFKACHLVQNIDLRHAMSF